MAHTDADFLARLEPGRDALWRLARLACWDRAGAEDCVLEVVARTARQRHAPPAGAPFREWIARALVDVVLDASSQVRRSLRVQRHAERLGPVAAAREERERRGGPAVDAERLATASGDAVRRAVLALPPAERLVFLLRAVEGLDYRAIAGLLGIPVGTVVSHLLGARARLRELLAAEVVAGGAGGADDSAAGGGAVSCGEARALLVPWLDGELEAAAADVLDAHLAACATCRHAFAAEASLERRIGAALCDPRGPDGVMPPEVWERVCRAARRAPVPWGRWIAGAALALVAFAAVLRLRPAGDPLLDAIARVHLESTGGGAPAAVRTGDVAELERFVAQVLESSDEPWELPEPDAWGGEPAVVYEGARRTRLLGQPAVAILLRRGAVPLSLVVMRRERLDALPVEAQAAPQRGEVSVDGLHVRALLADELLAGIVWPAGSAPPLLALPAAP